MRKISIFIFFSLIGLMFLYPASAACVGVPPNIPDCISDGVSSGIMKSMENSADYLVNLATNSSGNSTTAAVKSNLNNFMLDMLTPYFDPVDIPWVKHTRDFTALVYVILVVMYFTWGGAYHMLHNAIPTIGTDIDWFLGTNYRDFYFSTYAVNGVKAFAFPVLGYFGLTYLLLIAGAFTRLTVSDTLSVLAMGTLDPVAYFMMALIVFILGIFMLIRYIVITIFSAYLLIVLGAYLFDEIKPIAEVLLKYLIILIFMPFILAMIASGGIAFIEGSPWLMVNTATKYIALGLILVFAALVMVFGWRLVSGVSRTAAKLAVWSAI
jgi:hypothetical protein